MIFRVVLPLNVTAMVALQVPLKRPATTLPDLIEHMPRTDHLVRDPFGAT